MIWDGTEHRSGLKRRSGNYLTIGWFEGEIGRGHQISVPERREFADRRFQKLAEDLAEFRWNRWFHGLTTFIEGNKLFKDVDETTRWQIIDEAKQDIRFLRGNK